MISGPPVLPPDIFQLNFQPPSSNMKEESCNLDRWEEAFDPAATSNGCPRVAIRP